MHDLRHDPVEEITLPAKYRFGASSLTFARLITLYDDLRRDYLLTLKRLDDLSRGQWSAERQLESQILLNDQLREENARLAEAGRYALYGKPPPEPEEELSPVDEDSQ